MVRNKNFKTVRYVTNERKVIQSNSASLNLLRAWKLHFWCLKKSNLKSCDFENQWLQQIGTRIEAAQAIISFIGHNCSVGLYFLKKQSDYTFYLKSDRGSLVVLYVISGSFGKEDILGSEAKVNFHFGAMICWPERRIVKLFKPIFHGKLEN